MTRFCKYCGSKIEEGQICNCPENVKEINDLIRNKENKENRKVVLEKTAKEMAHSVKGYFHNSAGVTKNAIETENTKFIYSMGGIFLLSVVFNFMLFFAAIKSTIEDSMFATEIESNLFKLGVFGIILAVGIFAIILGVVFVFSKIKKINIDNKKLIYTVIINTIPMSLCYFVGGIIQIVLPLKGLVLLQVFYVVLFIMLTMSIVALVLNGRFNAIDVFIYTGVLYIAIVILLMISYKIGLEALGTYEINGVSLENGIGNIISSFLLY